jgi:hypothetical protein
MVATTVKALFTFAKDLPGGGYNQSSKAADASGALRILTSRLSL